MSATPYADALAAAATEALHAAITLDDTKLLDAVAHMSLGERLNVFRAARRLADVCAATGHNQPNPKTPPMYALLFQRYEIERLLTGLAFIVRYRNLDVRELSRVAFTKNSIIRQMKTQGVDLTLYRVPV